MHASQFPVIDVNPTPAPPCRAYVVLQGAYSERARARARQGHAAMQKKGAQHTWRKDLWQQGTYSRSSLLLVFLALAVECGTPAVRGAGWSQLPHAWDVGRPDRDDTSRARLFTCAGSALAEQSLKGLTSPGSYPPCSSCCREHSYEGDARNTFPRRLDETDGPASWACQAGEDPSSSCCGAVPAVLDVFTGTGACKALALLVQAVCVVRTCSAVGLPLPYSCFFRLPAALWPRGPRSGYEPLPYPRGVHPLCAL